MGGGVPALCSSPGLQGAQRARPGPQPPDALPDTTLPGAWTAAHLGHCTGHCPPQGWTLQRAVLPSSGHYSLLSVGPWTLFPLPPPGAQTPSPPKALVSDPLHPSARHCLLPVLFSLPLLPPHLSPARVGAPPVSPTPCSSAPAARAPISRLVARMPLPGGLWWLLCCRRGFTLLHRDYGDGELSGDGDEDEDEETFELRTPSPAGGGRVSPEGFGALSQSLLLPPAITPDPAPDSSEMPRSWRSWGHGRGFCLGFRSPRELREQLYSDLPLGLAPHAGRCPPAGDPEAGEASRVARPGPASPFPAGLASHPVSFRLRQRRGMWRGRLGGSDAWVRSAPLPDRER